MIASQNYRFCTILLQNYRF
uniref:Uncharacterized protein n=1 Tax=Arundo donax TaxID=35708 RepID=A0A0A9BPU2_ARUDO